MARTKKSEQTVTVPTVTDEQYKELLAIRLTAMHGFADGTVDEATMKLARSAIRKARKVRKSESEILEAYRQHLIAQAEARSAAAKKAASTRKSRKQPTTPVTEPVNENETEVVPETESPAEVAA